MTLNLGLTTIPWVALLVALLVLLALVGVVWAIVVWRRKRAAAKPPQAVGPSASERLRALWQPFYRRLPAHAIHYPTVVVMGAAGAGKTHAIGCHVDWRGQANQFMHSVDHGAAMQLYLGPDVVVHELSAPVLRDLGHDVKRGLQALWRNMGPSATVVLALDARTLLTTPPAALRELGQLVRGKISLFPQRCRDALDVRIYLSHLDQIEGYEEFAAAIGVDYGSLALGEAGDGHADAQRLLAAFDAHLGYALTTRSGAAFDRMVRFYGILPKLLVGLTPLLEVFAAKDQPFADRYPASALYLGSEMPRSHVGDPFAVERSLIAGSMGRQRRRGLRGSVAMAAALSSVVIGLMTWHGGRVAAAKQAVAEFEREQDGDAKVSDEETEAAHRVTWAIKVMDRSEILWFSRAFRLDKRAIDYRFERLIREHYLEPRLAKPDRVALLYTTALIYASHDDALGRLILANRAMWADELELSEWVIKAYVDSSRRPYDKPVALPHPDAIVPTGREWSDYLAELDACLADGTLSLAEGATLRERLPALRGPRQYEVLNEIRAIMRKDNDLRDRLESLLAGELDSWAGTNHDSLEALRETILALNLAPGDTSGWGLAQLVRELGRASEPARTQPYVLEFDKGELESVELDTVIMRSRRQALITAVLDQLDQQRPTGGRGLFSAGVRLPDAGVVSGYGGGPRRKISGVYTKEAFDVHVAPVFEFAAAKLLAGASADAADEGEAAAPADRFDVSADHRRRLERVIRDAGIAYGAAYSQELYSYYESFEFDAGSEVALPFVLKTFTRSSSWFTDFLTAVSRNAALELPNDDVGGYFEPMRLAVDEFQPLVKLLTEDAGAIPGLEPYQVVLASLQKRVSGTVGQSGDPEADELVARLSALGSLALGTVHGTEENYEELVADWLFGAGFDPSWNRPFLAPVEAVRAYGMLDVRTKVATAWLHDVRPQVQPLLGQYPFDPRADHDVSVEELEGFVRMQGDVPGAFWQAFDRLIRPAMVPGRIAMIDGVQAPGGMLAMARDLERLSQTLWDDKGKRVPLTISVKFRALPKAPVDGRVASMASLGAGGGSVHGFNQRPEQQALVLQWWDQGASVVTLKMTTPESEGEDFDERRFRLVASTTFSFLRLLDMAGRIDFGGHKATLTEVAMSKATRCGRNGPLGSKGVRVTWAVPIDGGAGTRATREVEVDLVSDPWAPFAVRNCR